MHRKMVVLYLFVFLLLGVVACGSGAETAVNETPEAATEPSTHIPTATIESSPTATSTPFPTLTTTPTLIPSATPSPFPTPYPTKQPLLIFGEFGGDGGDEYFYYLGRGMPALILYVDGQMLIRNGEFGSNDERSGFTYRQDILTTSEMCSLFTSIQNTGFFDVEADGSRWVDDPIYEFDSTVEFSEGGPSFVIQINGRDPKLVTIYYRYLAYVIDEVDKTYDLLSNYQLDEESHFEPDRIVLWIEEKNEETAGTKQNWPQDLPALSDLIADMDYEHYEGVLIQENIDSLLQLFDYRMKPMSFEEAGKEYLVTARPLLPHEPSNDFLWRINELVEFALPFECDE